MKKIIVVAILNVIFLSLVSFFTYNYVKSKKNRVKILEQEILKLQIEMDYSIPAGKTKLSLSPFTSEKFKTDKVNYTLKKTKVSNLTTSKHPGSIGNSYLDSVNNKLFVATANGIFSYINLDQFFLKNSHLTIIPSNIKNIIKDKKFYGRVGYGIKDLLIYKDKFYISYTNELKKNCYNTAILVAELNIERLFFEKFFVPKDCVKTENTANEYSPHQSGGRMFPYKDNKILFSVGEYRFRDHAQDRESIFGKILSIDVIKNDYEIISMGHRNPQGIFYDEKENIIFITEHGPAGGDEININISPGDEIENFGWAISSYGEHYEKKNKKYKKWPLYKSHKDYGFIEPIKYFTPSIAISEIISISQNFNKIRDKQIFVASMGNSIDEGDLSLHHFVMDKNFKIKNHNILKIGERIRDIIYIKKLNKIFLFLESSASIGILEADYTK